MFANKQMTKIQNPTDGLLQSCNVIVYLTLLVLELRVEKEQLELYVEEANTVIQPRAK